MKTVGGGGVAVWWGGGGGGGGGPKSPRPVRGRPSLPEGVVIFAPICLIIRGPGGPLFGGGEGGVGGSRGDWGRMVFKMRK